MGENLKWRDLEIEHNNTGNGLVWLTLGKVKIKKLCEELIHFR